MASTIGSGGATYRVGAQAGPADTVFLGVFRKTALERVGWYDQRFHRNEDAELNLRLTHAGYTVWFAPELQVDYRPRDDLRLLAKQYFANGRYGYASALLWVLFAIICVVTFLIFKLSKGAVFYSVEPEQAQSKPRTIGDSR
jgi:GT2 family glycosyltransferase